MAILAVGALLLSQCGDGEEATDGDQETTDTTAEVSDVPTTMAFEPPPAPEPLPPVEPPPAPAPAPAPAAAAPPAPAPSGPPPVAQGVMPDLAVAVDGYAHAVFVQEYFSGPVDGYSATSSDSGVARAGVRAPDMLIVAPVSNGAVSVTVTAFGAGGTATQTFTARIGAGPEPVTRPAAPAPAPAPPAPAPAPPPPAPDDSDELLPIDDDLPPTPPDSDAVPTDTLPPADATEAPTLSGQIPAQTVEVGQTLALNVTHYFGGVIQGWAVASSHPAIAEVSMTTRGRADVRGIAVGTATITVTASNNIDDVAQAFNVTVGAATTTTTTTTAAQTGSTATGFLVLVGNNPSVQVNVGGTTTLDISQYFSGATSFDVENVPSGAQVTVSGSVATITGVTAGDYTIRLVASSANASIKRPARIRVN